MAILHKKIEIKNSDKDLPLCRDATLEIAREAGMEPPATWDVASAVFEACVNAVTHGCKDKKSVRVSLDLKVYDDRFEATVTDPGEGFVCPAETPVPPVTATSGRGVPLMRMLMDDVKFRANKGFKVTLVKYLAKDSG